MGGRALDPSGALSFLWVGRLEPPPGESFRAAASSSTDAARPTSPPRSSEAARPPWALPSNSFSRARPPANFRRKPRAEPRTRYPRRRAPLLTVNKTGAAFSSTETPARHSPPKPPPIRRPISGDYRTPNPRAGRAAFSPTETTRPALTSREHTPPPERASSRVRPKGSALDRAPPSGPCCDPSMTAAADLTGHSLRASLITQAAGARFAFPSAAAHTLPHGQQPVHLLQR